MVPGPFLCWYHATIAIDQSHTYAMNIFAIYIGIFPEHIYHSFMYTRCLTYHLEWYHLVGIILCGITWCGIFSVIHNETLQTTCMAMVLSLYYRQFRSKTSANGSYLQTIYLAFYSLYNEDECVEYKWHM